MSQGLLIVDIQNDYFDGGSMQLVGMEQAAENAAAVLAQFREKECPVFHVQHLSVRPGSTFFVPGTDGVEINQQVAPIEGECLVQKHYPNSFRDTDLLDQVRASKVEALTIVGAMSHMCIDATTRAAFDFGFNCTVLQDACATRDLEFQGEKVQAGDVHASFMAALSAPYANVISCAGFDLDSHTGS